MTNFDELRNYIQENTERVTMKKITDKTWDIWHQMRTKNETTLDGDYFVKDMLSWYIICCECEKIVPRSGY